MEEVLKFIEVFQSPSNMKLFTECACFWFAKILHDRFDGIVLYNPGEIHFATKIDGKLYDIHGVIENPEDYVCWDIYNGEDREFIVDNCMRLT